ncbi:hypothetical protein [Pedococcus soli]
MTRSTSGRGPRHTAAVALGLAVVAAGSVAVSLAMGVGSGDARSNPSTSSGQQQSRALGHPTGAATTGVKPTGSSEARRLHALDPTQVARSVASDDATAKKPAAGTAAKGVWHLGEVGTYLVGKGIAPGTYESAGATQGECSWSRLRDLDGKATAVIQRGAGTGKAVVTIRSSDAFFETAHCQNWHKVA